MFNWLEVSKYILIFIGLVFLLFASFLFIRDVFVNKTFQGYGYRTAPIGQQIEKREPSPELIEAYKPLIERERAFVDTLEGEKREIFEEVFQRRYAKYLKYISEV
jgi:hypothetical protein